VIQAKTELLVPKVLLVLLALMVNAVPLALLELVVSRFAIQFLPLYFLLQIMF
jgi:hypothetical protein